jgi:hypothetical protein
MAVAASRFLDSLNEEQRAAACFPFEDDERFAWNYRPDGNVWQGKVILHRGLRLINMTWTQQALALGLLEVALSARGALQVRQIIAHEAILRETERIIQRVTPSVRDPELYAFSIFGEPGDPSAWGWRVGGHHVGLHFAVVDGDRMAPTPLFFGANPAQVRNGLLTGFKILPAEEDLARLLLRSLRPEQRRIAIVRSTAPDDILTDAHRTADRSLLPAGVRWGELSGEQRDHLAALIRHYLDRVVDEITEQAWRRIEQAGLDGLSFAWAGGEDPGQGHYYTVTGPTFMIEYDNTQNQANHVHTVWRDFTGDWGEDLLARHYAEAHHR